VERESNRPEKLMRSVEVYETEVSLQQLLEEVAKGESFLLLKHGVPVAILCPYKDREAYRAKLSNQEEM